jgi:two-component system, OmpR family, KDP operon response regulator KdpE
MTSEPQDFRCRTLLIEDENGVRKLLRLALETHGCQVLEATSATQGIELAATLRPELIILDLGLPDLDGFAVIERLRQWSHIPIIVLSAQSREDDKVRALDAGADDYLTKPFSVLELLARIRVALRHTVARTNAGAPVYQSGDLRVDLLRREVTLRGTPVHLTGNEFRLLAALVKHAGKVLSYDRLTQEMFNSDDGRKYSHHLQVYISNLRHKIEESPTEPRYLITAAGIGYKIVDSA